MLALDCDEHSTCCYVCSREWIPDIRLDCDHDDCGLVNWAECPCGEDEDADLVPV